MLSTRKNKMGATRRSGAVMFEALENRAMYANSSGMDIDVSQHIHSAPPAIVEYVNPDAQDTGTISSSTQSLGIYDSTWGGPSFGRNVYWTGNAGWSANPGLDLSRSRTEFLARLARDGGQTMWTYRNVAAGSMTVLDFEDKQMSTRSPNFMADRLRWFKAAAPNIKVGIFATLGLSEGWNNERLARNNAEDQAQFDKEILAKAEMYRASDYIIFDVYMLGPQRVDVDLQAHTNEAKNFRRLFPDKPLIPFVWGSYHTSWNPPNSVFSDEVTEKYVQNLRENFDGVVVWGPRIDNQKLIESLQREGNALLPADRKASWATETVTTSAPGARPSTGPSSNSSGNDTSGGALVDDVLGTVQSAK